MSNTNLALGKKFRTNLPTPCEYEKPLSLKREDSCDKKSLHHHCPFEKHSIYNVLDGDMNRSRENFELLCRADSICSLRGSKTQMSFNP